MSFEKFDAGADIGADAPIAQAGAARAHVVLAVGAVAMIEIRRGGEVAGLGQPARHALDKFIDAALMVDHHQRRKNSRAVRRAHVEGHGIGVGFGLLPK